MNFCKNIKTGKIYLECMWSADNKFIYLRAWKATGHMFKVSRESYFNNYEMTFEPKEGEGA